MSNTEEKKTKMKIRKVFVEGNLVDDKSKSKKEKNND